MSIALESRVYTRMELRNCLLESLILQLVILITVWMLISQITQKELLFY